MVTLNQTELRETNEPGVCCKKGLGIENEEDSPGRGNNILKACRMHVVWYGRSEESLWVSCKIKIRAGKVGEGPVINAIWCLFIEPKCHSKAMRSYHGFLGMRVTLSILHSKRITLAALWRKGNRTSWTVGPVRMLLQ